MAACRARAQYVGQNDRTFPILPGEQALNIYLGGPDVMRGQLRRLLDAVDLPGPSLGGGIPARAPPRSLPGGGFSIFDDHRVGVGGCRGAETITNQDRVDLFRKAFGAPPPLCRLRSGCPGPDRSCVGDELTARRHEWVRPSWSHCSSSVSAGNALPSRVRRWTGMSWEAHASSCSATR